MWVLDAAEGGSKGTTQSFHLMAGDWTVGRKKCHFSFSDDASVSRCHAVIRVGALSPAQLPDVQSRPALMLEDLQSRFGTYLNGQAIKAPRELKHGDEISFGAKRTVLRVRYQPFVLVASRVVRAQRARVSDACQRTGMHMLNKETPDATHCIVDQGKVIATAKVLWALVYNQPVVRTTWLFRVLERRSMSEPMPRCEDHLPVDEENPSWATNYLPSPKRTTLYQRHVIVFLAPQPMEALITAMSGVVVPAYATLEDDEALLRDIEQKAAGRVVLVVEGHGSSSMSTTTESKEQEYSQAALVERRTSLFQSLGTPFVTVQELAASVLFSKTPAVSSDIPFSNSLASHMGSSVQVMSFPDHLSLQPLVSTDNGDESGTQPIGNAVKGEAQEAYENTSHDNNILDLRKPVPRPSSSTESTKNDPSAETDINIIDFPMTAGDDFDASESKSEPPLAQDLSRDPSVDGADAKEEIVKTFQNEDLVSASTAVESSEWISRGHPRAIQRASESIENEYPGYKAVVQLCSLVVKRQKNLASANSSNDGQVNFKRFRKGNGHASVSKASLFPRPTVISVTIDNAERESIQKDLAAREEQERIADDLFAVAEGRKQKKLF